MWHMQLDSSRNHIILINLWLSMISISVMAATIVPAFFGMNLGSGLPDNQPGVFYSVCATSLVLAGVSFPLARRLFIRHWQRLVSQDQHEQRMLK
jgi:Mg2+ and Co2+ transporter CorA